MNIGLHAKKVLKFSLYCIGILFFLNFLAVVAKYAFNEEKLFGFSELVFLNAENNIPTFFSSLLIFSCAAVLFVIAVFYKKNNLKFYRHWMGLTVIFLALALDESVSLHEQLIEPVREGLGASGIFYFAWVIPALCMLPILFGAYYKFLLDLPKRTGFLFLVSGGTYVLGAVGMEMVGGYVRDVNGETSDTMSLLYTAVTTTEESLEMLGMALFLFALLSFLSQKVKQLEIKFHA